MNFSPKGSFFAGLEEDASRWGVGKAPPRPRPREVIILD